MSLLHRNDVGARHHDVVHPAPAQRQDVGEHDALLRREAALAERAALQHGLQIGARRAWLPVEHSAQHAREPAVSPGSRSGALGCGTTAGRFTRRGGSADRIAATWRVGVRHGEISPDACSVSGARFPCVRYGSGTPRRARMTRSSCSIVSACGVRCRDRSPAGGEIHARPDARDDRRTACLPSSASRAVVS